MSRYWCEQSQYLLQLCNLLAVVLDERAVRLQRQVALVSAKRILDRTESKNDSKIIINKPANKLSCENKRCNVDDSKA